MIDFTWGPTGAARQGDGRRLVVVVDVLSFSTAASVVVDRGGSVVPFPSGDRSAARALAAERGLTLAGRRDEGGLSLSPASLLAAPAGTRLLLPSPNGSRICAEASRHGATVAVGCLRNASAVARYARERFAAQDVCIVAAGERWPDATLRPAIEDELGAGAILDGLEGSFTPEADLVLSTYRAVRERVADLVRSSISGRELRDRGFGADVDMALERDASPGVPILVDGELVAARTIG
ncbi:2-phosphosulfolactate phosphatase [uncultured Alsobacter sp.]|uniref:2-phosphosulfolactate phosphatase n=1 Tax=uncultured Alsobacter sp. TaxID=1748258 RepID=UPI0025E4B8E3|nr:2-phosphosulfolactate phosphatase [uncultured Alsobacter sp.]